MNNAPVIDPSSITVGKHDHVNKPQIFNFSLALTYLNKGQKVARKGWNGKDMFIFLVPGSTFIVNSAPLLGIFPGGTEVNYMPHIDMKTADNKIVPWLASQDDVLATDWVIVE